MTRLQKIKDRPIASLSVLVAIGVAINAAWHWIDPTTIGPDDAVYLAKTATVFSIAFAVLQICDIFDLK